MLQFLERSYRPVVVNAWVAAPEVSRRGVAVGREQQLQ